MDDALLRSWLETMTGGGKLSPQEILAQLAESDPRLALLARLRGQMGAPTEQRDADVVAEEALTGNSEDDAGAIDGELRQTRARLKEARRIERMLMRMDAELQELRARNETLADALGACPLCWGDDPDCHECRGRGRPGAAAPEPELFQHFVLPAVRRAERLAARTRESPPGPVAKRKTGAQQ